MRYKPNYCCNCGEKVERLNPSFADCKMFCDVCKHDFVFQRMTPLIFSFLMAIVGIFGIGSYWRSGEKPLNLSTRQFIANSPNSGKTSANNASQVGSNSNVQQTAQTNNVQTNASNPSNLTTKTSAKQTIPPTVKSEELVYICGAPTKKGTPCSRRVRGGGRCWQHKGLEAMLPPEKLLVSQ